MRKQHKVRINLADDGGKEAPVLESSTELITGSATSPQALRSLTTAEPDF